MEENKYLLELFLVKSMLILNQSISYESFIRNMRHKALNRLIARFTIMARVLMFGRYDSNLRPSTPKVINNPSRTLYLKVMTK